MYKQITKCRICGNENLIPLVDLGVQYLTGVFPKTRDEPLTKGPLRLVKCHGRADGCGLLQLEHCYSPSEMYGENYGYRSGLNTSMVMHLQQKVATILKIVDLKTNDLVIDIGSNDGTTLNAYPKHLCLVGIDPTGNKFKEYYAPHVSLIPEFFSKSLLDEHFPSKKAKVITSFSMLYDLENPMQFVEAIASTLDPDGIWITEQSYLPLMLENNSYDTICHEHIEYYALHQIVWMVERFGMKIIDVELNKINGGSFSIIVAHNSSKLPVNFRNINKILGKESELNLNSLTPYQAFSNRIKQNREELCLFINQANKEHKRIVGLGASTKGNVILQYCDLGPDEIKVIADVNPDKFGSITPGSWIPIASQEEVLQQDVDYWFVLPWHFRAFFTSQQHFKKNRLLFPLPSLQTV